MSKSTIVALVIGLVIGAVGAYFLAPQPQLGGGFTDELNFKVFHEGMVLPTFTVASTTSTLRETDLGKTVYLQAASGTTVTLPAAKDGGFLRFVIALAFDTANVIIDSAEGDNISGVVEVNSLIVPCVAEDQINFVNTAESLGDYVDIVSDGTNWYIVGGAASSTASLTCTDPS